MISIKKKKYAPSLEFAENSHLNLHQYRDLYQQSIENADQFWSQQASQFITWFEPWKEVTTGNFSSANVKWFTEGKLNACYNCVDRHLIKNKNKVAIIWEGNHPDETLHLTCKRSARPVIDKIRFSRQF